MEKFLNLFLESSLLTSEFCRQNKLDKKEFVKFLKENWYIDRIKRTGEMIKKYHDACIEYNNALVSHTCIAKKFNLSAQSLLKDILELNLYDPSRKGLREKNYDETIFDSIDNEEKAYWLGFIFADGYIYSAPSRKTEGRIDYNFELSTSGIDKSHMEKFAKFIKYNKPIKETKADKNGHTRCRVCLSSKHLWNVLNDYGCTPNKSLTLQFPNIEIFKNSELIRHFLRGYFDGDGCLSYATADHLKPNIHVLGTEAFLSSYLLYLPDNLKNLQLFHNHHNINETTMYFSASYNKAMSFLLTIYKDSNIFLNRKYEKFIYFCRLYGQPYKELGSNIGESCDANPEISLETNKSEPSYSVENETV